MSQDIDWQPRVAVLSLDRLEFLHTTEDEHCLDWIPLCEIESVSFHFLVTEIEII